MHKINSWIFALFIGAGALTVTPEPVEAVIIDRVVARINAEIVTLHDVRQAATPYMLQRGIDPSRLANPAARDQMYKQVLEDLIERKLLLQEAAKLNLSVTDEEVDQWLAFTRQQQGLSDEQFRATIKQYGMKYSDYRSMVRQNLLRLRISRIRVGAKVAVSEPEVEEMYRARYGELGDKEKYITVSHILMQPADDSPEEMDAAIKRAEEARARVLGGEDFAAVATEVSEGPSAKNGGKLGTFRSGELDPEFEDSAFLLEAGEYSEIVKTRFGFHLIFVSAVEERENPDVEDRKEEIRAQLQQIGMERQLKSYVQTLKTRSFVEIKY